MRLARHCHKLSHRLIVYRSHGRLRTGRVSRQVWDLRCLRLSICDVPRGWGTCGAKWGRTCGLTRGGVRLMTAHGRPKYSGSADDHWLLYNLMRNAKLCGQQASSARGARRDLASTNSTHPPPFSPTAPTLMSAATAERQSPLAPLSVRTAAASGTSAQVPPMCTDHGKPKCTNPKLITGPPGHAPLSALRSDHLEGCAYF